MAVKSSHWFEVTILLAGLLVGSFAQGIVGRFNLSSHIAEHNDQIAALAVVDAENFNSLQAAFARRDELTMREMHALREDLSEVLQGLARMEGRR